MTGRRVTTPEAAALLDVKPGLIRAWKHRGLVVPVGLLPGRGKPSPLYDLEELRALADQHHRRSASDTPPSSPNMDCQGSAVT